MEKLNQIAKKHALFVIEDSAQSHGAKRGDWVSGSSGDVSGFSFYPGKNLGALGEAGAITTNSESINENCRLIRNYGSRNKYQHILRGNNFRMDEIQAAFLNLKINYLESWTESRIKNAKFYDEILDSFNISHTAPDSGRHVYHVYSALVENRNEVMQKMQKIGIGVSSHYPIPCHLQKGYAGEVRIGSSLEVSENLSKHLLSLPIDENLNHSSIERICNSLNSYL
jgi:dTDP-4-amino-4,6-dideoxygalactose transaminase